MERFDCHSQLHIAGHNGVAVVQITHQISHKSYVDIEIPEKWSTLIKDNYKMGPAKVCTDKAKAL